MIDFLSQALSYIGQFINAGLLTIANMFLGLFPDVSDGVAGTPIDNMFNAIVNWIQYNSLNLFYFFNLNYLYNAVLLGVGMVTVAILYRFASFVISLIHKILDSIPVIG